MQRGLHLSSGRAAPHIPGSAPETLRKRQKGGAACEFGRRAHTEKAGYLVMENLVQSHDIGVSFAESQRCHLFLSAGFHPER